MPEDIAVEYAGYLRRFEEAVGPLQPGEWSYAEAVDADHAINAGGVLSAWNPLAVLRVPVVLYRSAPYPTAVLRLPVVLE